MGKEVRKRSHEAEELNRHHAMIDALMDGTSGMRSAGKAHLPQWPGESDDAYSARLAAATLFPAYSRTVSVLTGKPFSKPVTVKDDVPSQVRELLADVDMDGRSLDQFAAGLAQEALAQGFAGILVDAPVNPGARTLQEEAAIGLRPYWVMIEADAILGWRTERRGAQRVLTQLRLLECVEEPDGEFGTAEVEQVRVLEPGRWRIFREQKTAAGMDWVLHDEGVTSIDFVPFVPAYGFYHEFMQGKPPMLELAHMNVEHWQSASDQQTIMHVARVPILFGKGFADGDSIVVGAHSFVSTENAAADLKYVEHSGAAIEAGRKSLLDLEDRMRQAGAELLIVKPGNATVVQTVADNEQASCDLRRITQGVEAALDAALDMTAKWLRLPSGGHVEIYKDFGAATMTEAHAQIIVGMEQAGSLSTKTTLAEMKRRDVLSPEVDIDGELAMLAAQRAERAATSKPASPADAGGA